VSGPRGAEAVDFPVPPSEALEHSRRVTDVIRSEIDSTGRCISFRRYMDLALYAPGLGYYSAGSTKLGRGGDFVTAPELSRLYPVCVARQCAQLLEKTGGVILEFGAGSGAMAVGILNALDAAGSLPDEYLILEPSADLRRRQHDLLRSLPDGIRRRVRWLDALPAQPLRGVILANEVLDAMPVHRVCLHGGSVHELGVRWQSCGFEWVRMPAGPDVAEAARAILGPFDALPDGYTTEFNPGLRAWIAAVGDVLHEGAVLIFDYGYPRCEYYHPDRREGTLICHYRHRAHPDPFLYPGLQDISASVDFTLVAEGATAAGLEVGGFTTQAHFLIGCGVHELHEPAAPADERERLEFAQQVRLLTLPGEMGERFKAIALLRGIAGPLTGFSAFDHRRRL
jgi:SAM-dependent MidA family methyltransferase